MSYMSYGVVQVLLPSLELDLSLGRLSSVDRASGVTLKKAMGDPGSELCLSDLKYLSSVVTHTSTVWSSHLARVFFKLRREK